MRVPSLAFQGSFSSGFSGKSRRPRQRMRFASTDKSADLAPTAKEGLKKVDKLPRYAVLVGHYTNADITAFYDFEMMKSGLMATRNSFISSDLETSFNRVKLPTDNIRKKRNEDHVTEVLLG